MKRRDRINFAARRIANLRSHALACPDHRVRREAFDMAAGAEIMLVQGDFDACARFCVEAEIVLAMEVEARR